MMTFHQFSFKLSVAGKSMSFYLIPYNYFEEDPSIASKDAQVEYPST